MNVKMTNQSKNGLKKSALKKFYLDFKIEALGP